MTDLIPPIGLPRPASPGFHCKIADRDLVVLNYRTRQTFRLCRAPGESTSTDMLYARADGRAVRESDLDGVTTVEGLDYRLREWGARLLMPRAGVRHPTPVPVVAGDKWLAGAIRAVERSITTVMSEFMTSPYMHRVEHSLHARLFEVLKSEPDLQATVGIHNGNARLETQLVHKEWPETIARSDNRRGAFDLAILSPNQFNDAVTVEHFLDGWIDAPIVIELGLDYDWWHLAQDCLKLINSGTVAAYVVHLTRGRVSRKDRIDQTNFDRAETWLNQPWDRTKTAYARFDPDQGTVVRYKRLAEGAVTGPNLPT